MARTGIVSAGLIQSIPMSQPRIDLECLRIEFTQCRRGAREPNRLQGDLAVAPGVASSPGPRAQIFHSQG